jgi:hypothetical protein
MPYIDRPPSVTDDGDWIAARSGRAWVGSWEIDDTEYEDVEVELDEGTVVAAWCCGEPASVELLKDLEERYDDV